MVYKSNVSITNSLIVKKVMRKFRCSKKKIDIDWCDKLIINKIIISSSNEIQSKFVNPIGGKKKYIYIYITKFFVYLSLLEKLFTSVALKIIIEQ